MSHQIKIISTSMNLIGEIILDIWAKQDDFLY